MSTKKSKKLCYLFALLLGVFGVHLFYVKKYKRGLLYLLFCWTFIPMFLGWIDMFFIHKWIKDGQIMKSNKEKELTLNDKNNFLRQSIDKENNIKNSEKVTDNNSEYGEYHNISCEKITSSSEAIEVSNSKNVEVNSSINRKTMFYKKKMPASSELFYNMENIILHKYSHLKTPKAIIDFLDEVRNHNKNIKSYNGINIEISFSTSNSEFAKDSLFYRNNKGISCKFKPLFKYWTTFRELDKEQKKWYFYWRDRALNGEYLNTDLSYIILFAYELLNYTFNEVAAFNVSMLERLYDNYRETQPGVKNYLSNWISDFLYELDEKDLSEEWVSQKVKNTNQLYEKILDNNEDLEKISINSWKSYIQNYRETEFLKANKNKINNAFKKSVALLHKIYSSENKNLHEMWFNEEQVVNNKYLFGSAVMARKVIQTEVKTIKYVPAKRMYSEITALFRLSENVVRKISGEKRQIKVEENILPESLKVLLLEKMQLQKGDVKINDRFKVVQKNSKSGAVVRIPEPDEERAAEKKIYFDMERINILNEQSVALQEVFREKGYEDEAVEATFPIKTTVKEVSTTKYENLNETISKSLFIPVMPADEDEEGFINSLTEGEVDFLQGFKNLKRNAQEANSYFKQQGMMAGTFISNVNEKANKYLDDNILELIGEYYEVFEEFEDLINIIKEGVKSR